MQSRATNALQGIVVTPRANDKSVIVLSLHATATYNRQKVH